MIAEKEFNNGEVNWRTLFTCVSCRMTPIYKAQNGELQCRIFFEGLSPNTFPLPVSMEHGYVYALLGESDAVILDCEESTEHLIIPAQIGDINILAVSGMNDRNEIKNVTIENGVLQICYGFLDNCKSLETVGLPSSIVRIAGEFCGRCEGVKAYKIIGEGSAFSEEEGVLFDKYKMCLIRYPAARSNLQYEFPESVREIFPNAFSSAVYLEKVIIPPGVEKIGRYAFSDSIKEVSLPDTLTNIDSRAFYMSNIEKISIPDSVTHIGERAFAYCSALSEIKMPPKLDDFGDFVFQECDRLEKIQIPEGVRKLKGTFYECRALSTLYIPESVEEIDEWTFLRDDKKYLDEITVCGKTGSFAERFAKEKGYKWQIKWSG